MTSTTNRDAREKLGRQNTGNHPDPLADYYKARERLEHSADRPVSMTADDVYFCTVRQDDLRALLADQPLRGDKGSDQPPPSVAGHPEQGALLSGWRSIETAPFDRPFYARSPDGDVALCWRFKPSSRTDAILRWGYHRNRPFKGAAEWRLPDPLPADGTGRAPSPPQTAEAVPGMNNNPPPKGGE